MEEPQPKKPWPSHAKESNDNTILADLSVGIISDTAPAQDVPSSQQTEELPLSKEEANDFLRKAIQAPDSLSTAKHGIYAKAMTVAAVAKKLLNEEAVLLSTAFTYMLDVLHHKFAITSTQNVTRLKDHLSATFGKYIQMIFVKGHKTTGYIIVRADGDAMAQLLNALQRDRIEFNEEMSDEPSVTTLNHLLYAQAQTWSELGSPSTYTTVDIDREIASVDVRLWKSVWHLTCPQSRRQSASEDAETMQRGPAEAQNSRRMKCFFILCCLAHTINKSCHYPLHLLLADTIDSHSSSALLLRCLSHFGVCSSSDTLERLKAGIVDARQKGALVDQLSLEAFSFTTIDNIDRSAPGKRISASNDRAGFHGTSVQYVAPMPVTCRVSATDLQAEPHPVPDFFRVRSTSIEPNTSG